MNSRMVRQMIWAMSLAFAFSGIASGQGAVNVREPDTRTISILGATSCAEWTSIRASQNDPPGMRTMREIVPISWLLGFLTGLNAADDGGNALGAIDGETIADWMDGYCANHAKKDLYDGGKALYKKLKGMSG